MNKLLASLLATLNHKAEIVRDLGAELFIPLHFDAEFAQMEASEFLEKLCAAPVRTIAVGEDWRFGHNRSGDVAFLEREAELRGFHLEAVPPVMLPPPWDTVNVTVAPGTGLPKVSSTSTAGDGVTD